VNNAVKVETSFLSSACDIMCVGVRGNYCDHGDQAVLWLVDPSCAGWSLYKRSLRRITSFQDYSENLAMSTPNNSG